MLSPVHSRKHADALKEQMKAALLPVEATLKVSPFLAGDDASYVDWVLYGRSVARSAICFATRPRTTRTSADKSLGSLLRYVMVAATSQALADETFKAHAGVADWIARLEKRYEEREEWRDHLDRLHNASS